MTTPETPAAAPFVLRPRPVWQRLLLAVLAWASLAMGFIGLLVPGIPGAVFVIVAAWAAAQSSPRLHAWLLHHRVFGPVIRDWHQHGAVSRRNKWLACGGLGVSIATLWLPAVPLPLWARALGSLGLASIALWLWRRPEPARAGDSGHPRREG